MKILKYKEIKSLRDEWLKKNPYDALTEELIRYPTLDHNHKSTYCRGVLDRDSNQFVGKVESAFTRFLKHKTRYSLSYTLRGLAGYLEDNYEKEQIIHPSEVTKMIKRFSRLSGVKQKQILKLKVKEVAKDKKGRIQQFKQTLR